MSPKLIDKSYKINDIWAYLTHRVIIEKQMWCGNVWLLAHQGSLKYKMILFVLEVVFYLFEVPEWRGRHCHKCECFNCRRTG